MALSYRSVCAHTLLIVNNQDFSKTSISRRTSVLSELSSNSYSNNVTYFCCRRLPGGGRQRFKLWLLAIRHPDVSTSWDVLQQNSCVLRVCSNCVLDRGGKFQTAPIRHRRMKPRWRSFNFCWTHWQLDFTPCVESCDKINLKSLSGNRNLFAIISSLWLFILLSSHFRRETLVLVYWAWSSVEFN